MQQFPASRTNPVFRYLLPLMMLVAMAVLTLSPKEANAQSGKRVCVGQNGAYAIKIYKGASKKRRCQKEMREQNLSQSINFGKGTYMTCEHFASNYLKWEEWDPCYEMRNSAHAPYDNQIYKIAKIDRDTTIQGKGSACGAGGCTLTFNFGQSRSFTYNAGININTPIGGTVGFSYGSGQSASVLFGFSWLHGEEPGMNLNFTSNYPKWDLRTISALQQRLRAYTREIAEVEEQKEIMDLTRFCSQGQTVQAKNYHFPGSVFTYTVGPYSYLWSPNGPDTYAGAKLSFDDDNDDYGNGITATLGTVAIICGQGLQITTNPAVWRSGIDSDNLQWENYLTYNIID